MTSLTRWYPSLQIWSPCKNATSNGIILGPCAHTRNVNVTKFKFIRNTLTKLRSWQTFSLAMDTSDNFFFCCFYLNRKPFVRCLYSEKAMFTNLPLARKTLTENVFYSNKSRKKKKVVWWKSGRFSSFQESAEINVNYMNCVYFTSIILSYQENYPWVPIQPHTLAKESLTGYSSLL